MGAPFQRAREEREEREADAPRASLYLKGLVLTANPTEEGLIAQQRDRQIEEDSRRRENEERVAQYNYFAARASNRSAWARAGMG